MKDRLIGFLKTYCLFICIFALQKPFFMLFYRSLYEGVSWTEWLGVMWHGLPLDLSLAGYLTVVPGLLLICSAWTVSNLLRRIWYGYFAFVSVLLSVIFTVDLGLYEYWGFRLDVIASVLFLFFAQRCGGKCQYMGGNRGNYCNGCLCGGIIRDIPWRAVAETGFRTHEDTLSAFEGIGGTVAADRIIVYPDSRRIYSLHHEYREGVFQYRPAFEPCRH